MLTCVCRPVNGNLPRMPPNGMPMSMTCGSQPFAVVTAEPKINVSPSSKYSSPILQHDPFLIPLKIQEKTQTYVIFSQIPNPINLNSLGNSEEKKN